MANAEWRMANAECRMPNSEALLLLGTSISGKPGEAARREAAAQASLAALAGIDCVNLAFHDDPPGLGILPQRRVLKQDAPGVTGVPGPRKPVVSEMLDVLAAEAAERNIPRIGVVNGDIVVLPEAIDRIASLDRPAFAIGRTDVGGGVPDKTLLHGIDMFVFDRAFWEKEGRRFRPYLLGETIWDNVYASIAACHGGAILNRERLILHERHPSVTRDSPFGVYQHALATRDRSYFSLWCTYVARAEALLARGGSAAEDLALQAEVFRPPSMAADAIDFGRAVWWRARRLLGA
jgi:hypothetical protein